MISLHLWLNLVDCSSPVFIVRVTVKNEGKMFSGFRYLCVNPVPASPQLCDIGFFWKQTWESCGDPQCVLVEVQAPVCMPGQRMMSFSVDLHLNPSRQSLEPRASPFLAIQTTASRPRWTYCWPSLAPPTPVLGLQCPVAMSSFSHACWGWSSQAGAASAHTREPAPSLVPFLCCDLRWVCLWSEQGNPSEGSFMLPSGSSCFPASTLETEVPLL